MPTGDFINNVSASKQDLVDAVKEIGDSVSKRLDDMERSVSKRLTDQVKIQTLELRSEINETLGTKLDDHTTKIALLGQEQHTHGREIGEIKKHSRAKRAIDYAKFSALGSLMAGVVYGALKLLDK